MTDKPSSAASDVGLSKTLSEAETSAREAYHGGTDAPDGPRPLGRKDPEQSGDSAPESENVPRR